MALELKQVDQIMQDMHESFRYRWCDGGPCGCMGCANGSGRAASNGVTREDWEIWVALNPDPAKPFDQAAFESLYICIQPKE